MQIEETKTDGISLMRNENFLKREISASISNLQKYPSLSGLRKTIAEYHNVGEKNVILGAGITGVFRTVISALKGSGVESINYPTNVYSGLERTMKLAGIKQDLFSDVELIVNPSNPEGVLEKDRFNGVINIVDEAYLEYFENGSAISVIPEISAGRGGLIAMRTFSKAHGLSSIRVGYAIASDDVCGRLRIEEGNYSISEHSARIAISAIKDSDDFLERSRRANKESKDILESGLIRLGYEIKTNCANFIVSNVPDVKGYPTRDVSGYVGFEGYRRITTHKKEIMIDYLNKLEALKNA